MLLAKKKIMGTISGGNQSGSSSPKAEQGARDPLELQSVTPNSCFPITLKFMDVCYKVKLENNGKNHIKKIFSVGATSSGVAATERTILNGITGMVSPGEILAVLGPSGSGKSTLLNALAGRLRGHCLTGSILANDKKMTKSVLHRTGFVNQDDVLYPHLTVRETLVFCALLKLPNTLSKQEKVIIAERAMLEVGLGKCEHTIIGNAFTRGVSGGERKRVSIAHEMLINPSLLILDEPTSGLDSTSAQRLVAALSETAEKGRRTVVMSIHQPSSRAYQAFRSVLVLSAEGRCIYFGKGTEAMAYFEGIGFNPNFPMNPADFLLDLANGVYHLESGSERDKQVIKHSLVSSYNTLLAPKVKATCIPSQTLTMDSHSHISRESQTKTLTSNGFSMWCKQFHILLQRSLKERRHEAFNSLRVFQVLAASTLAGSMWWHSDMRDIQDRLGLLFFISIFWGVLPSFNAVFAFPQERAIFVKERSSGMYTLSSYFMSRVVADLPMELILPTIFITITYWMCGLKSDFGAFLLTLLVLLGYVLASQGLGLALGALIMDAKQASTIVTVTMLAFVLTGGYYVHKVPLGMAWMKYISNTFYSYRLLINVQYGEGERIAALLGCYHGSNNATCKFIEDDIEGQIHPGVSVAALIVMVVGYRLLAYIALRRIRT